jgi:hypothetical protein
LPLDLHRKRFNRPQNSLRNCLSLIPQEQNMPPSTLRVSTTERTPRASKTHVSRITKTRFPPHCHALTTQDSHNSSSSFQPRPADNVLFENRRYIPSTQNRTPKAAQEHSTLHINIKANQQQSYSRLERCRPFTF